jgi:hypothetical protein
VDQLIGIGSGAAVLAAAAGYFTLRRPGVAVLAGIAAAATWLVFVIEWMVYDTRENGPVYAKSTEYVQYRDAIESTGLAIGFGYAVLAGVVVIAAGRLGRTHAWNPGIPAAAIAIALPLLVPAALPRGAPQQALAPAGQLILTPNPQPSQPPSTPEPPPRLPQPRAALSDGRTQAELLRAAGRMRECRRSYRTYVACADNPYVRSTSSTSFVASAYSSSGISYTVTDRGRTCSPRAMGACPASGAW